MQIDPTFRATFDDPNRPPRLCRALMRNDFPVDYRESRRNHDCNFEHSSSIWRAASILSALVRRR